MDLGRGSGGDENGALTGKKCRRWEGEGARLVTLGGNGHGWSSTADLKVEKRGKNVAED